MNATNEELRAELKQLSDKYNAQSAVIEQMRTLVKNTFAQSCSPKRWLYAKNDFAAVLDGAHP